jgi:predicted enzyme related to lactoylglutathione lyase
MERKPHLYRHGELVVVIDCADTERAAGFWTAVLGYVRHGESAGPYRTLLPADGAGIEVLLQRVPEAKGAKNRVHLDLRTPDLDAEVARVLALGARRLTERPLVEDGLRWHVLADPDGNEFCVLQPLPPDC